MLIASLALSCAAPAPPSPAPPTPGEPDPRAAIIEQAKKEGEVVIAGSNADYFMEKAQGFKKKHPFITVKGLSLNTTKVVNRIVTEFSAGRVSVDLVDTAEDRAYMLAQEGALQKPVASSPI